MTKLVLILTPEGLLDSVLTSDDIDVDILTRGRDDNKIDESESLLTELELT